MPLATVTLTLGSLNAGTQVKYSVANNRTPSEVSVNANSAGLVTLPLSNSDSLVYLVTLPDGQFFRLPIRATDSTIGLGTMPVYPQGVPPGLEDITALISVLVAPAAGDVSYAVGGGTENFVQIPNASGDQKDSIIEQSDTDEVSIDGDLIVTGAIDNDPLTAALAAKAPLSGPIFVDGVTLPASVLFNDGSTVYPILVGPADSGGTGFRMLRIANAS